MMGHKVCFYGEIWQIIPKLSLLPLLIWSTVQDIGSCLYMYMTLCILKADLMMSEIAYDSCGPDIRAHSLGTCKVMLDSKFTF